MRTMVTDCDLYAADLAYQQSLGMTGSGLTDARLLDLAETWQGELGECRVVDHLDQRVDDRLRVDHDVDRGKWEVEVVAEADAPLDAVEAVVRGVQRRSGEGADPDRLTTEAFREALDAPLSQLER